MHTLTLHCALASASRICLVSLCACTDPEDFATSEQSQAELIEIVECRPGFLTLGEGVNTVCIPDPAWDAADRSGRLEPDLSDRSGGPGSDHGADDTSTNADSKPARMDCSGLDREDCYACCYYNYDEVDGWECRKLRNRVSRKLCWIDAGIVLGACQAACPPDPGVLTFGAQP